MNEFNKVLEEVCRELWLTLKSDDADDMTFEEFLYEVRIEAETMLGI